MTKTPNLYTSLHHRIEQGIARGESNEQISAALGVTPVTVDEARDAMDAAIAEDDDEPVRREEPHDTHCYGISRHVRPRRPFDRRSAMTDLDPSGLTREQLEGEVKELRGEVGELRGEVSALNSALDAEREIAEGNNRVEHEAPTALHEQAHGPHSVRFCQLEPCRTVESRYVGPAPVSLVMI